MGADALELSRFSRLCQSSGHSQKRGGRYRFYHDLLREHLATQITLDLEPKPDPKQKRFQLPWLVKFSLWIALVALLPLIPANITQFNSDFLSAMSPTIQTSDHIWVDRITYSRWRPPQQGDIVIFTTQEGLAVEFPYTFATRRILALPNDQLRIRNGRIQLNGEPFTADYLHLPPDFTQPSITLDADEYYLIGDNPDYPDLETFGIVVPRENMEGELLLRVYPLNRLGLVE
ncbi:signal peptidase I [Spirulina sp. CS-785/01]|uniref:signal peptidase I n=1 Tax=Spirulina sp. CS-785/01 TaxID=3021716 RepID=UPI00232BA854|nr:signal peptidase I [Spirulina sp. CS-785/01]MDB9315729.1 signal peptidase I [Spirulina sp. CS-785/01]